MIEAKLRARTPSRKVSESFVRAIAPDSMNMKGLRLETRVAANSFEIMLGFQGRIETFISTLDDMLACLQAANATLRRVSGETG